MILIIFCAVAAPAWFARDKEGFDSPALPESLLGFLTLSLIPLALLLIVFAMRGFQQGWNVEAGSRADLEARGLLGGPGDPRPPPRPPPRGRRRAARPRRSRPTAAWSASSAPSASPRTCASSGWAFPLRFQRGAFADYTGTVSTREPHAVLAPYPEPGKRGVFEHGDVRIETDDGEVVEERKNARAAFGGRRNIWWDDLDLLYFGGYALWGYVGAPFIFTRAGVRGRGDRALARGRRGVAGAARALPGGRSRPLARAVATTSAPTACSAATTTRPRSSAAGRRPRTTAGTTATSAGFKIPTGGAAMPRGPGGRPVRAIADRDDRDRRRQRPE